MHKPLFLNEGDNADNLNIDPEGEAALVEVAKHLGLLVTVEEAAALNSFMDRAEAAGPEVLGEARSIVRLTKNDKLTGLTVRSALVIARQKKDPLFARYARFAELKRKLRDMILSKYSNQARTTARKILQNAGKSNMVDVSATKTFGNPQS